MNSLRNFAKTTALVLFPGSGSNTEEPRPQMQTSVTIDITALVTKFRSLNRNIRMLCDKTSTSISQHMTLPSTPVPNLVQGDSQLAKPPWDFMVPEDYCFFTLLSIVNMHLYREILKPFHPNLDEKENSKYLKMYADKVKATTCTFSAK